MLSITCEKYVLPKACTQKCPQAYWMLLIMKPSKQLLKIDSFPDADLAGMYRIDARMILSVSTIELDM